MHSPPLFSGLREGSRGSEIGAGAQQGPQRLLRPPSGPRAEPDAWWRTRVPELLSKWHVSAHTAVSPPPAHRDIDVTLM